MRALHAARRPQARAGRRARPAAARGRARCRSRIKAVALNHIDLWGFRGMAFAKRKLPLVVGAEAAGEIAAVGDGVDRLQAGRSGGDVRRADLRHLQGLPRGPRQSLRERRRHHGLPRRRLRPRPAQHAGAARHPGARRASTHARRRLRADRLLHRRAHAVRQRQAASRARPSWCRPAAPASAPSRSRWPRRSAAPSSPRSATTTRPRRRRRSAPITSSTTAPTASRAIARKLTDKKGVDVVFEHVGADTFNGSLLVLKRGGRLVTCGSTVGPDRHAST